jgi:hypothetical protein
MMSVVMMRSEGNRSSNSSVSFWPTKPVRQSTPRAHEPTSCTGDQDGLDVGREPERVVSWDGHVVVLALGSECREVGNTRIARLHLYRPSLSSHRIGPERLLPARATEPDRMWRFYSQGLGRIANNRTNIANN